MVPTIVSKPKIDLGMFTGNPATILIPVYCLDHESFMEFSVSCLLRFLIACLIVFVHPLIVFKPNTRPMLLYLVLVYENHFTIIKTLPSHTKTRIQNPKTLLSMLSKKSMLNFKGALINQSG